MSVAATSNHHFKPPPHSTTSHKASNISGVTGGPQTEGAIAAAIESSKPKAIAEVLLVPPPEDSRTVNWKYDPTVRSFAPSHCGLLYKVANGNCDATAVLTALLVSAAK
jgi:hypothetical protein